MFSKLIRSLGHKSQTKTQLNDEDVQLQRELTPGTRSVVHFNNAGSSLPTTLTLNTVKYYLDCEATIGGYETVTKHYGDLKHRPYSALARLLHCQPEEIAVLSSCTNAWQQVIYGLAWNWKPGDVILTSVAEYGSNYIAYLQLSKRTGVVIQVIPETPSGDVCLESLHKACESSSNNIVLIAMTHVPTSSGRVYNAAAIGTIARKFNILYMLDACQSVGQMPIDVDLLKCDFLAGTGRKYLRAPRGSGFLYCRSSALGKFEPAAIDNTGAAWTSKDSYTLDSTAKRFEVYEMSMAARLGLAVAVEQYLDLGVDAVWNRIQYLAGYLRLELDKIPSVQVLDHGQLLCGIVSFNVVDSDSEEVQRVLSAAGINTSVSYIGSTRLDFEARNLQTIVRASVHYYNTKEEIDKLITCLIHL